MPLLAALIALLLLAPAAHAQFTPLDEQTGSGVGEESGSAVDDAVQGLRSGNVFVHPDAEDLLSPAEADRVRDAIREGDVGPVYVAVLPESAADESGGDLQGVVRRLFEGVGRPGYYVAAVPGEIEAAGTAGGGGEAMNAALDAHRDEGLEAILVGFVEEVAAGRSGGSGDGGPSGEGSGLILLGLLGLGGGAYLVSKRNRRRREREDLAEVKGQVRDDLVTLGDEIRALDLDVQMPGANPEAVADYHRAVQAYQRAEDAWERARVVEDLEPVGSALEEGRWAMQSARARLDGRRPPERRAPCFFDPRHGPSTRDVEWAPYGGQPRPVPACEADALRVEAGEDPEARELLVGGQRVPYWQAGPAYAPFMGWFFGGGLFPGLLMGTMLGGAMFPGIAFGDGFGGGDGGGGLGDFGGGDFGGGLGDFGGGDF